MHHEAKMKPCARNRRHSVPGVPSSAFRVRNLPPEVRWLPHMAVSPYKAET